MAVPPTPTDRLQDTLHRLRVRAALGTRARGALDRARHTQLERRMAGPKLLQAFAESYPAATFVEVGSNDGEQHDHLRPHILGRSWTGVMVEPVPYIFARLRANYGHLDRVALENAAVGERDGTLPFFHLADASPEERSTLPSWYDGIGSFSRAAVLRHERHIPDVGERIVEAAVPTLTFEGLCAKHGLDRVDLVVVDTEGHDWEIVRRIDYAARRPRLLVYEHYHLGEEDRRSALAHLRELGYETLEEHFDTFCLDPLPDALTATFRALRPALPGISAYEEVVEAGPHPDLVQLTPEDRRYLTTLHDDTTPLPPGAETTLRRDNPRLAELRAAYAALDLPVLDASRWDAEAVEAFLDLRWFRGETLITWHYRELPRITALKFFVYARYVADRDPRGLLARLAEDGAFGCWTFDYPGYGRYSRDLLESVNEITFLDRQLDLTGHDGPRVLDIGAGYGRLAHRMTSALGNVADYCCVDAVPESTFLSEYYLEHRGASPTARVVALDRVETDLHPGGFDLAINIHSFPECTLVAVEWWIALLARLEVPRLLIVPNEPTELLSMEADGSRRDIAPSLATAGYVLRVLEPVIDDPAIRELLGLHDHFHLYERTAG